MNYKLLGSIPVDLLKDINAEASTRIDKSPLAYRIEFLSTSIIERFHKLLFPKEFNSTQFSINHSKAFISPPGTGCKWIHKDGIDAKVALNVVINCNPTDFIRWYSDEEINRQGGVVSQPIGTNIASRDLTSISNASDIPYVEEVTNQKIGHVYLINTDAFHYFKNQGNNYRVIIQTKFNSNPSIEELYKKIQKTGLNF